MRAQLLQSATGLRSALTPPHLHVRHRHFLQIRNVLFQVLQRVLDLQGKQAAQAGAVFYSSRLGLIKHLDSDRIPRVHQRWKTDQRLRTLADFQQLG